MDRRDFLKTSGAALLVPAIPARPGPAWVRDLRARIAAIPDDGWDQSTYEGDRRVHSKWVEATLPREPDDAAPARALGCVNREGFAGRRAGTVMLTSCGRAPDGGTRLRFAVRRGLRWDEWPDPATGKLRRVARDGRPLYRDFDFATL